jgi:hypothetical protein
VAAAMIMLSFNMAAPDLMVGRSCWAQQGDVSEVTAPHLPTYATSRQMMARKRQGLLSGVQLCT